MNDFIFGTFATDSSRMAHIQALNSGITHEYARFPFAPRPGEAVTVHLTLGPQKTFNNAWLYWSSDGQDPTGVHGKATHGQVTLMEKADPEWNVMEWGYLQHFQAAIPAQEEGQVVKYYLAASNEKGGEVMADGGRHYAYYTTAQGTPDWSQDAVIYQIMPDRFSTGEGRKFISPAKLTGFFGGTLAGITEKLEYIAQLGANVLWMTPIFASPSHHGYDATDLYAIEPRLGTKEDLRRLIDLAHEKGIRILLDFVPNHWSNENPLFQQALKDPNDPRTAWYHFHHWPDQYETFFGVKSLPKVNLRNPDARHYMLDVATYWLKFGVDGYRVDYAVGPTPDFWADFRKACVSARPECWLFGEVVEPPDSQRHFHGLLHGTLDFMLLEMIRKAFAYQSLDAEGFLAFLDRHEPYFPEGFSRPTFLDNHDMNRFLWAVKNDKTVLKLAALCQFTLSGQPVIYYGTEVGLNQERDVRHGGSGLEDARLPMPWGGDQDVELFRYYQTLIALRHREPALQIGSRKTLPLGQDLIAYSRQLDNRSLATVINLGKSQRTISIPGEWKRILFSSQEESAIRPGKDQAELDLPARSGSVLE